MKSVILKTLLAGTVTFIVLFFIGHGFEWVEMGNIEWGDPFMIRMSLFLSLVVLAIGFFGAMYEKKSNL